jgi:enamine deaminase RidA (YjgF/YER057c/UK114 family)
MHMQTLHPDNWKAAKGYANGVITSGRQIFVAGQIGWNSQQIFESNDFIGQFQQTLKNILAVLAQADARPEHIARMTWYITDRQAYLDCQKELGRVYKKLMGLYFPAMSVVQVAGLIEAQALLEIEVTAVIP